MRLLLAKQPDNACYQAACLLLEASPRPILRSSARAQAMALACADEIRRQELGKIADVSGIISTEPPQDFYQACQLFWY